MNRVWEHIKTEGVYILLHDNIVNKTSCGDCDGTRLCLYVPHDSTHDYYVRSYDEFMEKFQEIQLD